jgi:D-glycero-D-manno-heptose 1,7-bisphosphate phosphatase
VGVVGLIRLTTLVNKAVIKDRKPYAPKNLAELEILPGVLQALNNLYQREYKLIVVTNQPDVARGTVRIETVKEINSFLQSRLPIDDFFCCFHDDSDRCECRKPKSGAILSAAQKYDIDLAQSFMIGDRWRDIEAGISAGCKTIFLDYGYDEKQPTHLDYRTQSLYEASKIILGEKNE